MTAEVCATGPFDVTMNSLSENEACEEEEGNGFTLDTTKTTVVSSGTCTSTGTGAQGGATPTDPVTICCL